MFRYKFNLWGILKMRLFFNLTSRTAWVLCIVFMITAGIVAQDDPAMNKYYSANALYNKKLYDLAIDEYKNFLARYPEHNKALSAKLGLGLCYYETGKYRKAETIFTELADNKSAPHQEQIHNLLGQCLLLNNQAGKAEAAFRWSVNRGKERFFLDLPGVSKKYQESPQISMATIQDLEPLERSLAGLIEALYQQRKWEQVIRVTKDLVKLVPKGKYTLRARFLSALASYELKKYKEAADILKVLVKKKDSPYLEHSLFLLAECQHKLGNLEAAEGDYQTVAKKLKGKFTSNALFRLGFIKFQQKKYQSAIADFSDLRAIYAKSSYAPQAGIYLGRCYLELGEYADAQNVFGGLTHDSAMSAEATLWLAKTFSRQKKFNDAIAILKPAVVRFANHKLLPNLLFDYGTSLMGLNNYPQAAKVFNRAAKSFKDEKLAADSSRLEAFCLNRGKDYKKSLATCEYFEKTYKQDPYLRDVLFLKAENLYFLDKTAAADNVYRQFIPWEGTEKYTNEARFRIAQGLIQQKKYQKALFEIEPLVKEKLDTPFFEQLNYLGGVCAFKLQRWQEAIVFFDKFLDMYPNKENADSALMNGALAYAKLRDYDESIRYLKKLIDNYKDSVHIDQAYTELGKYYYNKDELKKARTALEHVTENYRKSPFFPFAEYYLGWVAISEDKTDEALERFSLICREFPKHKLAGDSLFQKAVLLMKNNAYEQAAKVLDIFLADYKKSPKREEATFYHCLALSKMGKYQKATKLFEKFLVDYPKSSFKPRVLYEMAWNARELKKPLSARDNYKALLKANPVGELADRTAFELAEIEYEQKNYDLAIGLLDKLLAKGVSDQLQEKILYRMAWCLLGREQTDLALETFEKLLDRYPKSEFVPVAAYQAGEARLLQKDYENAYKHFVNSAKTASNNDVKPQAILRLGEMETLTERWHDAEKTFNRFIKDYPQSKFRRRSFLWLGWTKENLKKYKEAIADYEKVLAGGKADELSARSRFQIGECWFALKEYDKAIKEFVNVELHYTSKNWVPKALLEMSQVLIKKGMDKEANEQLKKVVKKYPESDEANLARELLSERKVYSIK